MMNMKTERQLPQQVKGMPFFGPMKAINADLAQFLLDNTRELGDAYTFSVANKRAFVFHNPDVIREILQSWEIFRKAPPRRNPRWVGLGYFLGTGLLSNDGDFWKSQRKLIQPSFHAQYIRNYANTMLHYTNQMLADWRAGDVRDIEHEMMSLTLHIATKTLFNVEADDYTSMADSITEMQHESLKLLRSPLKLPQWMPTLENFKIRHLNKVVDDVVYNIIEKRKTSGDMEQGDLLSMLMNAKDENGDGMNPQQLRDEVITLFVAGHETTALTLSWLFYLLAENPHVQQCLYQEIEATIGNRAITLEDLRKMPYLNMVIDETLRLYPVGWLFPRFAYQNTTLAGYDIKAGDMVLTSPYVLHRDPRWFPNPEQFDPERFNEENSKSMGKYTYLPFGGGPRVCIGNSFAMMEMQIIVATIAQHYTLELLPNQTIVPEPLVTIRPKYGITMRLNPRKSV
jgi:cytochrome P450